MRKIGLFLLLGLVTAAFGQTNQEAIQSCYQSANQNRADETITNCTAAIKLAPNMVDLYVARGAAQLYKKNIDAALGDFTKALQLAPTNPQLLEFRAIAYGEKGDLAAAEADLNQAIKLAPGNISALFRRTMLHHHKGNKAAAIADLQTILQIQPQDQNAQRMLAQLQGTTPTQQPSFVFRGTTLTTPEMFLQAVAKVEGEIEGKIASTILPSQSFNLDMKLASEKARSPEIINLLLQCTSRFPENLGCNKKLLTNYEKVNTDATFKESAAARQIEAVLIPIYSAVIKNEPTNGRAYLGRATKYFYEKKDFNLAVADLTKAIELTPKAPSFYFDLRARAYKELKNYDLAIADYTQIITASPKNASAYKARAQIYFEQKKYDLALADINKAIEFESFPTLKPWHLYYRGKVYSELKKYDLAVADFTTVLTSETSAKEVWIERSKAYRAWGKTALAVADEDKAKEIETRNNQPKR